MAVEKAKGHYIIKVFYFSGHQQEHALPAGWVPFHATLGEEGHGGDHWITARKWVK